MAERNADLKFGILPTEPLTHLSNSAQQIGGILMFQVIVSVIILISFRPPFVLDEGDLCPLRVAVITSLSIGCTLALRVAGAEPSDTFVKACEIIYRVCKA